MNDLMYILHVQVQYYCRLVSTELRLAQTGRLECSKYVTREFINSYLCHEEIYAYCAAKYTSLPQTVEDKPLAALAARLHPPQSSEFRS